METKKIGIIGHFGGDKEFFDGQTIKTKEINAYFENKFNINTVKFDTYGIGKNIFKVISGISKVVKNSDVIVVILSTRGYSVVLPLLSLFNLKGKKVLDFVIGGNRQDTLKRKKSLQKLAKKIDKIYVETRLMKEEYDELGFNNVEVLPNFKNLNATELGEFVNKKELRLCTFSRVCKEKGIEDAICAVNRCNEILGDKGKIVLDIYGQIDSGYIEKFEELKASFSDGVRYMGMVDSSKSVDVLKEYDLLLFLTYWQGEGFPGTIIDAFFSGIPTLATDWNFNFEILNDGVTGIKIQPQNIEQAVEKIMFYFDNQEELYKMKGNCLKEAENYMPDSVMKNVVEYIQKD